MQKASTAKPSSIEADENYRKAQVRVQCADGVYSCVHLIYALYPIYVCSDTGVEGPFVAAAAAGDLRNWQVWLVDSAASAHVMHRTITLASNRLQLARS